MLKTTKNYELVQPTLDEFYDVEIQNGNMERLDQALKELEDSKAVQTDVEASIERQNEIISVKADQENPVFTGKVTLPELSVNPEDNEAATVKFVRENGGGAAVGVSIMEATQKVTGASEKNVESALSSVGIRTSGLETALPTPTEAGTILYSTGEGVRRNIPFLIGEPKPISDFSVEKYEGKWKKLSAPYPDDLVAYIDFLNDINPSKGNFTLSTIGVTNTLGYYDQARYFSGNGYIASSARIIPRGTKSIRFKVKIPETVAKYSACIAEIGSNASSSGFSVQIDSMRRVFINDASGSGSWNVQTCGNIVLSPNEWHDILATWTGSGGTNCVSLYIDGELDVKGDAKNSDSVSSFNTHIGSLGNQVSKFTGIIDEIEIYNTIKTPEDFEIDIPGLKLSWTNPTDLLIPQTVHIQRSSETYPATLEEGIEVYNGSDESCLDETADLSADQFYTAWVDNSMVAKTDESMRVKYSHGVDYLMLYDHGDECADVTGGWRLSSGSTGTARKDNNSLFVDGTGNGKLSMFTTTSTINLTGYGNISALTQCTKLDIGGNYSMCIDITDIANPNFNIRYSDENRYQACIRSNQTSKTWISSDVKTDPAVYIDIWSDNTVNRAGNCYAIALFRTDDYAPWVRAGGMNPSDYATLDALLANETAMGILMNSSAAVDRMIRYTGTVMAGVINSELAMTALGNSPYVTGVMQNPDWAKFLAMSPYLSVWDNQANTKKVPVMTSNTAPSGAVIFSDWYGSANRDPFMAFDGTTNDSFWASSATPFPHWIGYDFEETIQLYRFVVCASTNTLASNSVKNFVLQAFNDSKWTDVERYFNPNEPMGSITEFVVHSPINASKYRLLIEDSYSSYAGLVNVAELQFYGK